MKKRSAMAGGSRKSILCMLIAALVSLWPSTLFAMSPPDEQPSVEWSHKYGSYIKVHHLNQTDQGYYLAGVALRDLVNLSWVDRTGLLEQSTTFYLTGDNGKRVTITSAMPTSDGGFILSGTYPEFYYFDSISYAAKIDAAGELEWSKAFIRDIGYAELYEIKEDAAGNFIYSLTQSGEPMFMVVGQLDANGQEVWETTLKSGTFFELWNMDTFSIEQSREGEYTVISSHRGKLDIYNLDGAGEVAWHKSYDGFKPSVGISLGHGGYAIVSSDYRTDTVLTLINSSGEMVRTQNYGVQGKALSLEMMDDGGFLIGTVRGALKTDGEGNLQWAKTDLEWITTVVPTHDGGTILLTQYGNIIKLSAPAHSEQIRSLAFDSDSYSLSVNQTLDTVVTAVYGHGELGNVTGQVTYASSDPSIVSIDSAGNITGLRLGEATITAESSGVEASAIVYVYGSAPQARLQLDSSEYSLSVGQTLDLVVTYIRGDHSSIVPPDSFLISAEPAIVAVDSEGNITGAGRGQTILTVTYEGLEATAVVDVY
ncbi:Ig-like domain-containing protein [Paenibacillus lentus]|uniref:Ig-like domain-containing protein n=1 Tax=Paenibacillus lentus TaxID=1338368 RepID=UPI00364A1AF0